MLGFETLARLHDIPVVRSSTDLVQNLYSKAKDTSVLIRYPCSVAENVADKSLKIALTLASPLVQPFSRPVHAIDEFAAEKLRQLEKKYPLINSTPDDVLDSLTEKTEPVRQVVHSAKDKATSTIQQGKETFSNVASATVNKATGVADSVLSYCSSATESQKRSTSCRIGQLKSFVLSTINASVNYVHQSVQLNVVWLRMFIIYNLLKVKQTNDFILSATSQIPLLKNFSQRFLIFFGATLEHVAERIRPDDRTLSELERRKSTKFFAQLPRFEADPSLQSQPDVIGNDQHVFPPRSYASNSLYARLAASGNSDIDELHQRVRLTETNGSQQHVERTNDEEATGPARPDDIAELRRRVRPTDIEELYARVGTDIMPTDAIDEPLTEDQAELLARVDANDSD